MIRLAWRKPKRKLKILQINRLILFCLLHSGIHTGICAELQLGFHHSNEALDFVVLQIACVSSLPYQLSLSLLIVIECNDRLWIAGKHTQLMHILCLHRLKPTQTVPCIILLGLKKAITNQNCNLLFCFNSDGGFNGVQCNNNFLPFCGVRKVGHCEQQQWSFRRLLVVGFLISSGCFRFSSNTQPFNPLPPLQWDSFSPDWPLSPTYLRFLF